MGSELAVAVDGRYCLRHADSGKWSAATYHAHLQRRPNTIAKNGSASDESPVRVMGSVNGGEMIVSRRNRCSNTSIHCTALSSPMKAPEPIGRPVMNDINHRTSPLSHIKNIII